MKSVIMFLCAVLVFALLCAPCFAAAPASSELKAASAWSKAAFRPAPVCDPGALEEKKTEDPRKVGLLVHANNDPVFLNQRDGKPLKIKDKEYKTGIYAHAVSDVEVFLPENTVRLTAEVGLDAHSGGGSVEFIVEDDNGRQLFKSPLFTQGMDPVPLDIALASPKSIHLKVTDGGDGIPCDQSDWGDIAIYTSDGAKKELGSFEFLKKPVAMTKRAPSFVPFCFNYGGVSSDLLLSGWDYEEESKALDKKRLQTTQIYTDPATGLEVRCVRVDYRDFPISEWTLWFKNTGSGNTPNISEVRSLDITVKQKGKEPFLLHHADGAPATNHDYRPRLTELTDDQILHIYPESGRSTGSDWPYFNLETGGKGGVIAVIGWPGQWSCDFVSAGSSARISGGYEKADFVLYPGEEIRSPLNVVMHYEGDWERAQNIWRQFMWAYNVPKSAEPMQVACSSHWFMEMTKADTASQLYFIDRYREEGFHLKYWWMDAGWYPCGGNWPETSGEWPRTGTWEVDTARYPGGFKEISDYAHRQDVGILVWFEPERVGDPKSWLATEHPEWLLGGTLLNLGIPECREWLTKHVGDLIEKEGIDLYRQDYNIAPASFWRAADKPGRIGMTEIKYVMGYLAYWDALLERFPGMLIDSCASGGHRNDLETMRRAVPLLRSDYLHEPVGQQNHTYGINYWLPYYGSGGSVYDTYALRSLLVPSFNSCWDMRRKDLDYDELRKFIHDLQQVVAPNFYGDYYPLTPYSLGNDIWTVFQFHRPKEGKGVLVAYRREDCQQNVTTVSLRDLKKDKTYLLTDIDTGETWSMTGKKLMKGFKIKRDKKRDSAIITFEIGD